MFNPARGAAAIKNEFVKYITTALSFPKNPKTGKSLLGEQFQQKLNEIITKGPFVELNCTFKKGKTINQLIDEGVLSPLFREIERGKNPEYKRLIPLDRTLYVHQEKAIRQITSGKNAVITTGTGSGKTECFFYPLLDSLLKEQEAGTLDDSVRAILIYPMNALANDQMKRLRKILMNYPSISFGVFSGETPKEEDETQIYCDLHADDEYEELRTPLKNERVTRAQFEKQPPHILCTNYAMLDYMLLTPNRGAVFQGAKVKFIILDEAHTYSGATGIETALLLRRLIARLNARKNNSPQFILTSATLGEQGESEADIVGFAKNLTGCVFDAGDIIFSKRNTNVNLLDNNDYPIDIFDEIAECEPKSVPEIFAKYNIFYDTELPNEANIYNLCEKTSYYKILRQLYSEPVEIATVAQWLKISEDKAVNFLHVCTMGQKEGTSLIELRYHFFVRALEGLYLDFTHERKMYLERQEEVEGKKVFEISICKNCGDIAIVGHIEKHNGLEYLVSREKSLFAATSNEDNSTYFHILHDNLDVAEDDVEFDELDEDDAVLEDDELEKKKEAEVTELKNTHDYWLCPYCGELSLVADGLPTCEHNEAAFIRVRAYDKKVKFRRSKCLYCQQGTYNRFYIGTESATSVLATALFQALPTAVKDVPTEYGGTYPVIAGKQFLSFSDSRSEAAYFASYVDQRYENLISKRALVQLLKKNAEQIKEDRWTLDELAAKLGRFFVTNNTFREDLLEAPNEKELRKKSLIKAWTVVLKELISSRRNESLQGLGLLKFEYLGNSDDIVRYYQKKYFSNLDCGNVKALLDELAMTFAYFGAIKIPECFQETSTNESDEIIKNVFFTSNQKGIAQGKKKFAMPWIGHWIPMQNPNTGKYYQTYRWQLALCALDGNQENAENFLKEYFGTLTNYKAPYHAESIGSKPEFAMPAEYFTIKIAGMENCIWYRCKKCGKITTFNFKGKCGVSKCDGELEVIDDMALLMTGNYYHDFYQSNDSYLQKLLIREHTAQLSRTDSAKYQVAFEKNNINALSCSTTFEMGVDVGELETVFLRDIPPTAANYTQRAGRAGRSIDSAAFVLSYAKLSSHDFHYYEHPAEMINGKITPPVFNIENKKIYFRHIYATLFGYFFNTHQNIFEDENKKERTIKDFLDLGEELFLEMIKHPNEELVRLIKNAFEGLPGVFEDDGTFGTEWIAELLGDNGRFSTAIKAFRDTLEEFEDCKEKYEQTKPKGYEEKIARLYRRKTRYEGTKILEFLKRSNVIPKYGFPVDTAELLLSMDYLYDKDGNELRLNRNLTQAISDYAPGCKIIANGRMYTSRYITRYWKNRTYDFDTIHIRTCGNCGTLNVAAQPKQNWRCVGCNHDLSGSLDMEAITPTAGMICETVGGEAVPLIRPKRIYRSDYYFIEEKKDAHTIVLDIGDQKVTITSSRQDTIGVTTSAQAPLYVCRSCGFAYGEFDKIKYLKGGKPVVDEKAMKAMKIGAPQIETEGKHLRPNGEECNCHKLFKRLLYHSFQTDIVQISFNNMMFDYANDDMAHDITSGDQNKSPEAISILYALIDSMANVLHVERREINGVVSRESGNTNTNFKFILFDNVPGGAGHVKRLLDNDCEMLQRVINFAYEKTKYCTCDENTSCYKCLRTYENQKYHTLLSRKMVFSFLEKYYMQSPQIHTVKKMTIKRTTSFSYSNWSDFFELMGQQFEENVITIFQEQNVRLPSHLYPKVYLDGEELPYQPVLYWEQEKVILFAKQQKAFVRSEKNADDYNFFVADDEFDTDEFLQKFKEE